MSEGLRSKTLAHASGSGVVHQEQRVRLRLDELQPDDPVLDAHVFAHAVEQVVDRLAGAVVGVGEELRGGQDRFARRTGRRRRTRRGARAAGPRPRPSPAGPPGRRRSRTASRAWLTPAAQQAASTAIRTARPLVTWSRIAEFGPSATSGVISTPRLIGPGARSSTSGFARSQPLAVHAEEAGVLADRREQPAPLPLELDAQQVEHVAPRQDVVEVVRRPRRPSRPTSRGTSVGGPQTITFAPSFVRPWMLLRATRLWAMSPTRPTVSPSTVPLLAGGW